MEYFFFKWLQSQEWKLERGYAELCDISMSVSLVWRVEKQPHTDAHSLVPGLYEYGILHGKGIIAQTELRSAKII